MVINSTALLVLVIGIKALVSCVAAFTSSFLESPVEEEMTKVVRNLNKYKGRMVQGGEESTVLRLLCALDGEQNQLSLVFL